MFAGQFSISANKITMLLSPTNNVPRVFKKNCAFLSLEISYILPFPLAGIRLLMVARKWPANSNRLFTLLAIDLARPGERRHYFVNILYASILDKQTNVTLAVILVRGRFNHFKVNVYTKFKFGCG